MNELLNALYLIKEECKKHSVCDDCPLAIGENCKVSDQEYIPEDWHLIPKKINPDELFLENDDD